MLQQRIGTRPMIVTHGSAGAQLIDGGGNTTVPTQPVSAPVDICGAGDSFSAGAALTLAVSGDAHRALRFGNIVSSITIMKKGTGSASPDEVLAACVNWPR